MAEKDRMTLFGDFFFSEVKREGSPLVSAEDRSFVGAERLGWSACGRRRSLMSGPVKARGGQAQDKEGKKGQRIGGKHKNFSH